jgi:hypothetical protein
VANETELKIISLYEHALRPESNCSGNISVVSFIKAYSIELSIILKRMLPCWDVNGFIWLWIGTCGGHFQHNNETSDSINKGGAGFLG